MKGINLLGQGGISRIVIDIIKNNSKEYFIQSIYDDSELKRNTFFCDIPTSGTIIEYINSPSSSGTIYFNCLGNINAIKARISYANQLKNKDFLCINIIHPNSIISKESAIGVGNLICPGAIISSNVSIGDENLIWSNTVIEHDSIVGDLSYLSPSVTICGKVVLENNVYIGPGAVITAGVKIGRNSIIGAGAVVLHDVPENSVYVGNPAKFLKINNLWGGL